VAYTKFGERAFCVPGPTIWNSLPESLRSKTTTTIFSCHNVAGNQRDISPSKPAPKKENYHKNNTNVRNTVHISTYNSQ